MIRGWSDVTGIGHVKAMKRMRQHLSQGPLAPCFLDSDVGSHTGEAREYGSQESLRKTSLIAESSAASLNGLMRTVALTRWKKNSIAGLFW